MLNVFVTKHIPEPHNEITLGPFILVQPGFEKDEGLIKHAQVHVYQWLMFFVPFSLIALFAAKMGVHWYDYSAIPIFIAIFGFGFMYLASWRFRFACEVKAYREQLKWYPEYKASLFAMFIATRYNLPITYNDALLALIEGKDAK